MRLAPTVRSVPTACPGENEPEQAVFEFTDGPQVADLGYVYGTDPAVLESELSELVAMTQAELAAASAT